MSDGPTIQARIKATGDADVQAALSRVKDSSQKTFNGVNSDAQKSGGGISSVFKSAESGVNSAMGVISGAFMSAFSGAVTAANNVASAIGEIGAVAGVTGAAAGAGLAGLVVVLRSLVEESDKLDAALERVAKNTHIPVESIEYMRSRVTRTEGNPDSVNNSLGHAQDRFFHAAEAGPNVQTPFKRLGIDIKNADGSLRDFNGVFADTVATIASISDSTLRAHAAFEVFGSDYKDFLDAIEGAEETQKGRVADGMAKLKKSISDAFSDVVGGANPISEFLVDHSNQIISVASAIADKISDLKDDLDSAFSGNDENIDNGFISTIAPALREIRDIFSDIAGALQGESKLGDTVPQLKAVGDAIDFISDAWKSLQEGFSGENEAETAYPILYSIGSAAAFVVDQLKEFSDEIIENKDTIVGYVETALKPAKDAIEAFRATMGVGQISSENMFAGMEEGFLFVESIPRKLSDAVNYAVTNIQQLIASVDWKVVKEGAISAFESLKSAGLVVWDVLKKVAAALGLKDKNGEGNALELIIIGLVIHFTGLVGIVTSAIGYFAKFSAEALVAGIVLAPIVASLILLGTVILAVGAMIALFGYVVYKTVSFIYDGIVWVLGGIKDVAASMVDAFLHPIETIKKMWDGLWNWINDGAKRASYSVRKAFHMTGADELSPDEESGMRGESDQVKNEKPAAQSTAAPNGQGIFGQISAVMDAFKASNSSGIIAGASQILPRWTPPKTDFAGPSNEDNDEDKRVTGTVGADGMPVQGELESYEHFKNRWNDAMEAKSNGTPAGNDAGSDGSKTNESDQKQVVNFNFGDKTAQLEGLKSQVDLLAEALREHMTLQRSPQLRGAEY